MTVQSQPTYADLYSFPSRCSHPAVQIPSSETSYAFVSDTNDGRNRVVLEPDLRESPLVGAATEKYCLAKGQRVLVHAQIIAVLSSMILSGSPNRGVSQTTCEVRGFMRTTGGALPGKAYLHICLERVSLM
jgi:hypothetical protein